MSNNQEIITGAVQGKTYTVMQNIYATLKSSSSYVVHSKNIENVKRQFKQCTGEDVQAEFLGRDVWRLYLKK